VWLVVVVAILLWLLTLTTPWSRMAYYYGVIFESNLRTFGVAVLAAFLFFIMLAWFRVFLDTLLIISASILVKVDFQSAGYKEWLAFCMASIFSLAGLTLGALGYQLIRCQAFSLYTCS
jgi:hypothetical protein